MRVSRRQLLFAPIVLIPIAVLGLILTGYAIPILAYITGKHGSCSLPETLQALTDSRRQIARAKELTSTSSIVRTDPDGTVLWNTPDGPWWVPTTSSDALLYDLAEQDRDIYRSATGIRAGDVVLDCGANIGLFTRQALRRGAARVVAIEPAPENIKALRKNFAAEIASSKVTIYEKGVWDKDDTLVMHIDPDNSARDSFVRQAGKTQDLLLPLTTIDHLVAELNLNRVDFIKMDIEGAERHAVAGAQEVIRRDHPRMALCVYHLPDDPQVIRRTVMSISKKYEVGTGCLLVATPSAIAEVQHFRPN